MSKENRVLFGMPVIALLVLVLLLGTGIRAHAVFDNNFNVTWTNGSGNKKGTASITGTANSMDNSFSMIITKYKTVITFISAVGAVTMVAIFILNFMKLGATSSNPTERSRCITALIWSGLSAAGLGSVALVTGIFYGALRDG